jgi:nitrogen fixation NifU-like protein
LKGKTVDEAIKIDNMEIVEELHLPPVKIHCSVLAEDAIKAAVNDYRKKNGYLSLSLKRVLFIKK